MNFGNINKCFYYIDVGYLKEQFPQANEQKISFLLGKLQHYQQNIIDDVKIMLQDQGRCGKGCEYFVFLKQQSAIFECLRKIQTWEFNCEKYQKNMFDLKNDRYKNEKLKFEIMQGTRFQHRFAMPKIAVGMLCAHCKCKKTVCPNEKFCFYRYIDLKKVKIDSATGLRSGEFSHHYPANCWNLKGIGPGDFYDFGYKYSLDYWNRLCEYWDCIFKRLQKKLQKQKIDKSLPSNHNENLHQLQSLLGKMQEMLKKQNATLDSNIIHLKQIQAHELSQVNGLIETMINGCEDLQRQDEWIENERIVMEREYQLFMACEKVSFIEHLCELIKNRIAYKWN